MNRIPFLRVGLFVMTCFFMASCDLPPSQQAENVADGKPTVGVIAGGTTSFWKAAEYGASQTAEINDLHLVWQATSQSDDFDQQAATIRNFAARRFQGVIIATQNELMIRDTVERAADQGIHVLFIDSPPLQCTENNSSSYFSVVATDQFHAGQLAAEELAKLIQEKGRVAIIRYSPLSLKTEHREKGFLAQMQSYPEIDVVGHDLYTGTDTRLAREKMAIFLQIYSKNGKTELDGVFISDESTACEILSLIEQEKLGKRIRFVTFGTDTRLINGVLTEQVDAIFVEQPVRMGQLAVDAMAELLRGKTIAPFIDSGAHCITIDNIFSPFSRALLNPQVENSLEILLNEFSDSKVDENNEENR